MVYFDIIAPSQASANNAQEIGAFADSTNSNILSTKLDDYTVVPIAMLSNAFFANGTTDGMDFIIQSDLMTDIGLVVNFNTDGGANYLGNFYGINSEYNAQFGEYFGLNVETGVEFSILTGSFGNVNIVPKATAVQRQIFNVYGGSTFTNVVRLNANDDINNLSVQLLNTPVSGVEISADEDADENHIFLTGKTQNIIGCDGQLNIDSDGILALNSNDDIILIAANDYTATIDKDVTIQSATGFIYLSSVLDAVTIEGDQGFFIRSIAGGTIGTIDAPAIEVFFTQTCDFFGPDLQFNRTEYLDNAAAVAAGLLTGSVYTNSVTKALTVVV